MAVFLGNFKVFPSIQDVDEVLIAEWLDCAADTAKIVALMGKQFAMTKNDMEGNIGKIKKKYETDKEKFKLFKDILQDEKDNKSDKDDKSATVGGLWLKRGLEYLCEMFAEIIKEHENSKLPGQKSDNSSIKIACETAYEKTLKKHHGLPTRLLVKAALKLSPYKEVFMKNLGIENKDLTVDQIVDDMKVYEAALREYIIVVCKLFTQDECIASGQVVQES